MSAMFAPWLFAVSLLGFSMPGEGQSLSEVARKERERRSRISGESPVIGEKELAEGRGSTFSQTGEESPPASTAQRAPADDVSEPPELSEKEIRDLRQKWSRLWQEQMAAARKALAKAQDDVYQCRAAESFFFVPLAVDCNGVEERLIEAREELEQVQANRYNWELLLPR